MTLPNNGPSRLSGLQAFFWTGAFLATAALVVLYFIYGRQLRALLGD